MTPAGLGVVGLSVGGSRPGVLDEFIHALGRDHTVVNVLGHVGPIDWMIVYRSPTEIPAGIPAAWYLASATDLAAVSRPAVVMSTEQQLLDACHTAAPKVLVPRQPVDLPGAPWAPYPRERVRRARGLPAAPIGEVTVDGCRWDGVSAPVHLRDTILTTAAAVIADRENVLAALAHAAPTVTDPATAAEIGAEPGVHLLVGTDLDTRRRLAAELAGDMVTAARLSWAGRTLYEGAHSMRRLILTVSHAAAPLTGPADRISRVFAALNTPDDAAVRARTAPMYGFPPAPSLAEHSEQERGQQ